MATYNPSVLHDDAVEEHTQMRVTHTPDFIHRLTEVAMRERSLNGLLAMLKIGAGMLVTFGILLGIGQPSVVVFSAFSAGMAMLYLAGLLDITRLRDAAVLLIPVVFIWGLLMIDHRHVLLVGLALFTHVCTTFFAGVSKTSGSIQSLGLWPFLFGMHVSAALIYGALYLL